MFKSRLTGLAVVVLGLLTIFVLIPVGIVSPRDVKTIALAPEFWPLIIASALTFMGIIMTVRRPEESQQQEDGPVTLADWKQRTPRLAIVLAALFGFYYLTPVLGMVVCGILLISGLTWFAGEHRWKLIATIAITAPVVLYLFFYFVANIPIPHGVLESVFN